MYVYIQLIKQFTLKGIMFNAYIEEHILFNCAMLFPFVSINFTHTLTHTLIHTYTYTYIHTHTHTYIHIHILLYIHTHTHTYIHIHTYTHTHIHFMTCAMIVRLEEKKLFEHLFLRHFGQTHFHVLSGGGTRSTETSFVNYLFIR